MADVSIKYFTGYFVKNKFTVSDNEPQKYFRASWKHFPPPLAPQNVDFSISQTAYTALNWGTGSIRELWLDANKTEQVLHYRKASFSKCVSTTFVAHCSYQQTTAYKYPLTVNMDRYFMVPLQFHPALATIPSLLPQLLYLNHTGF